MALVQYRNPEGEPGGFEHLILQSFAEERDLGLEVVWVEEFNEIFDLLLEADALSEKSFFAFVFRPEDPLRAEVDEHLAVLQQDGRFWTFLEQSFGDLLQVPVSELKADFLRP